MEKEYLTFKSERAEYPQGLGFTWNTYIKQRQEYRNLNYRMNKGYDAKTLHPLPKDK